jgi:hypothetical protein
MRWAERCGCAVRRAAEAGRPQPESGQAQAGGVDGEQSAQARFVSRTLSLSVTGALADPGALARRRQGGRPCRAGRRAGRAGVRPRDAHAGHGRHGRHARHARHGCACRAEVGTFFQSPPCDRTLRALEFAWVNIGLLVLRGGAAAPGQPATDPEPASACCELRTLLPTRPRVPARATRPAWLRARQQADRAAAAQVTRTMTTTMMTCHWAGRRRGRGRAGRPRRRARRRGRARSRRAARPGHWGAGRQGGKGHRVSCILRPPVTPGSESLGNCELAGGAAREGERCCAPGAVSSALTFSRQAIRERPRLRASPCRDRRGARGQQGTLDKVRGAAGAAVGSAREGLASALEGAKGIIGGLAGGGAAEPGAQTGEL